MERDQTPKTEGGHIIPSDWVPNINWENVPKNTKLHELVTIITIA